MNARGGNKIARVDAVTVQPIVALNIHRTGAAGIRVFEAPFTGSAWKYTGFADTANALVDTVAEKEVVALLIIRARINAGIILLIASLALRTWEHTGVTDSVVGARRDT